jgi:hypothetical protein
MSSLTDRIAFGYRKSQESAKFFEAFLADPATRNEIDTAGKAQELIDIMEDEIYHDELPACYDWLVARLNQLTAKEGAA